MEAAHTVLAIEVRQGVGAAQDTVVAAGRKLRAIGGLGEKGSAFVVGGGDFIQ